MVDQLKREMLQITITVVFGNLETISSCYALCQIGPGLNANEIQIPHDKHHKVSSLVKSHQNTQFCQMWSNMKMSNNPAKYEVLIKQCLRSIMDISELWGKWSIHGLFSQFRAQCQLKERERIVDALYLGTSKLRIIFLDWGLWCSN